MEYIISTTISIPKKKRRSGQTEAARIKQLEKHNDILRDLVNTLMDANEGNQELISGLVGALVQNYPK